MTATWSDYLIVHRCGGTQAAIGLFLERDGALTQARRLAKGCCGVITVLERTQGFAAGKFTSDATCIASYAGDTPHEEGR